MTNSPNTPSTSILQIGQRLLATNGAILLAALFLIVFPHLVGWATDTNPFARRGLSVFWQSIVIELLIFAILSMSYNLVFGFTGVISFGHALFFGLGGYFLGGFHRAGGDAGLVVGILLGLAVCGVLGLLVGFVSLRLKGVYFAMFTLAVAEMVFIFLRSYQPTGSEDGFALNALPEWFDPSRNRLTLYYLVFGLFVFTFWFIRRLVNSPTGAVMLAIRENENRAQAIGFDTLRYKLFAITLSAVLASMAGMLFTVLNKKVGPEMLSSAFTVEPLLMTIIGGIGTFAGPVIGAFGLKLTERLLRDLKVQIGGLSLDIGASWSLILGAIFILVVIVFPRGVVGTLSLLRARLSRPAQAEPRPAASTSPQSM
jgi:branched-chain amino acid transport system permease protein